MARRPAKPVEDSPAAARQAAVRILKTRLISRSALVTRLVRRGFSRGSAEAAAEALERVGLLDDRRLAESLVRKQMGSKPVGKRVLESKLRQRGISGTAAGAAVAQGMAGRDVLADAIDLARRRARLLKPGEDPQVVHRRLFGYLARRGFDAEVCREAVGRVTGDSGDLGDR